MCAKRLGRQTLLLDNAPGVSASASVAGGKEGEGPLKRSFDFISDDARFGERSWERSESALLKKCLALACGKAGLAPEALDLIISGDLLNQCAGSAYALRETGAPYLGLYGACSTMSEALNLGSILIDAGAAQNVAVLTGSHFCSAERQFRFPLEYGALRTPTSQWTVTGAGALILRHAARPVQGDGPRAGLLRRRHNRGPRPHGLRDTRGAAGGGGRRARREAHGLRLCHIRREAAGRPLRRERLRLLGKRAGGICAGEYALRTLEAGPLRRHRRAHEPDDLPAGREHPRYLPRRGARDGGVTWTCFSPASGPSSPEGRSAQ